MDTAGIRMEDFLPSKKIFLPTLPHWTKSPRDSLELTALVMLGGMRGCDTWDRRREGTCRPHTRRSVRSYRQRSVPRQSSYSTNRVTALFLHELARIWTCPACRTTHHRDHNAAINVYREGASSLGGDRVRLSERAAVGDPRILVLEGGEYVNSASAPPQTGAVRCRCAR
jgi:hypothetical protein